jgi:MULE transposase domain
MYSYNFRMLQYHLDGEGSFEPIFAAKPVLTGNVAIVLCTPTMRKWARMYMHGRVLVMDSTFGLNRHGYSLFAIMAVGDQGNGVPVCFMITKTEDADCIEGALLQFKLFLDDGTGENEPFIKPHTALTDDSKSEQLALRCVPLTHSHMQFTMQSRLSFEIEVGRDDCSL